MKTIHKIICILILLISVYLVYIFLTKHETFEDINLDSLQNSFIIEDTNIINNTIKINNNVYDISGINNEQSSIEKERRYTNNYECNSIAQQLFFLLNIDNHINYIDKYGTVEEKQTLYQLLNRNDSGEEINEFINNYISDKPIIYNSKLDSNIGWIDIYDGENKTYIEIELTNERIINGIIIQSFTLENSVLQNKNFIIISDFIVEISNDAIQWETVKNKNNESETNVFHINYTMSNTINKLTRNTETNEPIIEPIKLDITQSNIETITTYEIENINSKYLILLDTFIKCKYIRVYPIKYYITKEINEYIYIINNEDSMQFFNTDMCNIDKPNRVGMRLGLVSTEYIPSSSTQPSTTQPSTTQPSTTQPSTTQPSTTQPSTTQPLQYQPLPLDFDDFNIGMMLKGNNNEGNLNDFLAKNTMLGNNIYISPNGMSGGGFDSNDDFFEESSKNKLIDSSFYPMIELQ